MSHSGIDVAVRFGFAVSVPELIEPDFVGGLESPTETAVKTV
jgi:hypothetical protein